MADAANFERKRVDVHEMTLTIGGRQTREESHLLHPSNGTLKKRKKRQKTKGGDDDNQLLVVEGKHIQSRLEVEVKTR